MPQEGLSSDHKLAMAQGRTESRAINAYLKAAETNRPKRGRKRTPETIRKRLEAIASDIPHASPIARLGLVQERLILEAELDTLSSGTDLTALEDEFVKVAKAYSERKGISYTAWRELGVSPGVLKRAGIGRTA